ncbi:uncharacterized protein LOC124866281 [Girardinichthys multiradiatus]|uniref:uncharacterized protein LOC124866281 n=1 Tax=Girardinichthys multiradiatus TaxID=208333 RepID=UPI001FAD7B35|nr:uncharacterized protein LOC124866281 [Girardinichthys multiradiatus]
MAGLHFQVFLFAFLLNIAPECRGSETVSAFKVEDVALLCLNFNVTDPLTCYRIRLTKYTDASSPTVVFQYPKKSQDAKRVNLEANRKGQTCVFLRTLQKSDEGMYNFEIWKGWDKINVTEIFLKVKDCRTLKVETANPGMPVTLNCSEDAETAPSNVTWAKLKGSNSVPVDLTRAEMKEVFLTIPSVSASDSGWYRCDYIVRQSQRCSKINLHVKSRQEDVSEITMVPSPTFTKTQPAFFQDFKANEKDENETSILVVVLVLTLIITLAALTGLFIYKRLKSQRNSAGCFQRSEDFYENVTLPCSPDATDQINSLYAFPEEVQMHTFIES